ncbi:MAG: RNA polymerase sigma factor [Bacilli bacterium]
MDISKEVIKRVCLGDEKAFEKLFRANWESAVQTCWLILKNEHDAQEVAQDAFVKLYEHRRSLRDVHAFRSWFYRILVNAALDKIRKRKASVDIDTVFLPAPDSNLLQSERRMYIDQAMLQLSYEERVAIVLVYFTGLTEKSAAGALGWRLGKLKYRLQRARDVLGKSMNDEIEENIIHPTGGFRNV